MSPSDIPELDRRKPAARIPGAPPPPFLEPMASANPETARLDGYRDAWLQFAQAGPANSEAVRRPAPPHLHRQPGRPPAEPVPRLDQPPAEPRGQLDQQLLQELRELRRQLNEQERRLTKNVRDLVEQEQSWPAWLGEQTGLLGQGLIVYMAFNQSYDYLVTKRTATYEGLRKWGWRSAESVRDAGQLWWSELRAGPETKQLLKEAHRINAEAPLLLGTWDALGRFRTKFRDLLREGPYSIDPDDIRARQEKADEIAALVKSKPPERQKWNLDGSHGRNRSHQVRLGLVRGYFRQTMLDIAAKVNAINKWTDERERIRRLLEVNSRDAALRTSVLGNENPLPDSADVGDINRLKGDEAGLQGDAARAQKEIDLLARELGELGERRAKLRAELMRAEGEARVARTGRKSMLDVVREPDPGVADPDRLTVELVNSLKEDVAREKSRKIFLEGESKRLREIADRVRDTYAARNSGTESERLVQRLAVERAEAEARTAEEIAQEAKDRISDAEESFKAFRDREKKIAKQAGESAGVTERRLGGSWDKLDLSSPGAARTADWRDLGRFARLRQVIAQLQALDRSDSEIKRTIDLGTREPADNEVLEEARRSIAEKMTEKSGTLDAIAKEYIGNRPIGDGPEDRGYFDTVEAWHRSLDPNKPMYAELAESRLRKGDAGPRTYYHNAFSTFSAAGESAILKYLPPDSVARVILTKFKEARAVGESPAPSETGMIPGTEVQASPRGTPFPHQRNPELLQAGASGLFALALIQSGYRWWQGKPGATSDLVSLGAGFAAPAMVRLAVYKGARRLGAEETAARSMGASWGTGVATTIAFGYAGLSFSETWKAYSERQSALTSLAQLAPGNSPKRAELQKQVDHATQRAIFGAIDTTLGTVGAIAIKTKQGWLALGSGAAAYGVGFLERHFFGQPASPADQAANEPARAPKAAELTQPWPATLAPKPAPAGQGSVTV